MCKAETVKSIVFIEHQNFANIQQESANTPFKAECRIFEKKKNWDYPLKLAFFIHTQSSCHKPLVWHGKIL